MRTMVTVAERRMPRRNKQTLAFIITVTRKTIFEMALTNSCKPRSIQFNFVCETYPIFPYHFKLKLQAQGRMADQNNNTSKCKVNETPAHLAESISTTVVPSSNDIDEEEGQEEEEQGMGEVAHSSFLYLDHNGDVVPPEEETSWLMAQGIIPTSSDDDNDEQDGATAAIKTGQHPPSSTLTNVTTTTMEETPFAQDPDEFEKERNSASERLERALQLEAADAAGGASPAVASPNPSYDGEEDGEGSGGMMEETRTFSRARTADEDEWILESILRRRAIRQSASNISDRDYATFYDEFGKKSSGMKGAGWVEYLCKWKWYEEPTWEKRDLLIDEGYMQECNRFDDKVLGGSTALSGKGVVATRTSYIAKQIASGLSPSLPKIKPKSAKKIKRFYQYDDSSDDGSSSAAADDGDGDKNLRVLKYLYNNQQPPKPPKKPSENETSFGNSRPVEALAGITEHDIKWWFRKDDMKALRYGTIATQKKIDHFIRTYQSLQQTHLY